MKTIIPSSMSPRFNTEARLRPVNSPGTAVATALEPVGISAEAPGRAKRTRSGWTRAWSVMLLALLWGITDIPRVQAGNTHRFSADLSGYAEFDFAGSPLVPVGMQLWTVGKVMGFNPDTSLALHTDNPDIGSFNGTFSASRFTGGRNNSASEDLYGTVSGFSLLTDYGVVYFATITITGGTGKLEGATGTIYVTVYQYGYLDPADPFSPDGIPYRNPSDFIIEGDYTLP